MTNEIRQKRTLNSKHFQQENGKINGQFHAGHVHYFNKLGIGDSQNDYRSIDWTLSFDEIKRGWFFNYHSFHPFLPEYADEWVEFRDVFDGKDQTIKYKAHASHVKGRLVMPEDIGLKESSVNCVIYDDAFGEGKDYILYFTRSTLKKVVRIREKFKGKDEERFAWDIELPEKHIYRAENKIVVETELKTKSIVETAKAYELDTTRSKVFDSPKQLLIGNALLDGKEWFTYLKPFKVWDSGELENYHSEIVNVEFDAENKTITKIVSSEFIGKSVGDIFTDTTTSYYSGEQDGCIRKQQGTGTDGQSQAEWDALHDGTDGSGTYGTYIQIGTDNWWGDSKLYRGFLYFDTSGIGAGSSITAAALKLYGSAAGNASYNVGVTQSSASDTLANADYDQCGGLSAGATEGSDSRVAFNVSTSAYSSWTLNATGRGWISKTATTKLCVRDGTKDIDDVNPAYGYGGLLNMVTFYSSENTGSDKDPYLEVTYSAGSTAPTRSEILRRFRFHRR